MPFSDFVSSPEISDGIFQIPKWLEDNLLSYEYFRKNALIICLGNQEET